MNRNVMKKGYVISEGTKFMCIKECFHSRTHFSLIQQGPGDSMGDWVTNLSVRISLEILRPTKTGFYEIPLSFLFTRGRCQKHASKYNSAPNYLTMKKLYME